MNYNKLLKDVNNKDLYQVGLPDSVGSFMYAFIEDELNLEFKDVENHSLLWLVNEYRKYLANNTKGV